jgi:hypothetical protein
MELQEVVNQLRSERTRIDRAIAALEGLTLHPRRGRLPKARKRRHMSTSAGKRISAAMKQRWANWKGETGQSRDQESRYAYAHESGSEEAFVSADEGAVGREEGQRVGYDVPCPSGLPKGGQRRPGRPVLRQCLRALQGWRES